ncbi:MAG: DUF4426 domain-containing protein [Pseudomonadota bacterium]
MRSLLLVLLCLAPLATVAEQLKRYDQYELHYSVVNTTFLDPKVAATYQLVRADNRAILNLAALERTEDGNTARPMLIKGRTWDLTGKVSTLEFQEVREGPAIYYIAEFKFFSEDWRHFEVLFRPEGADKTYTFKHRQQVYEEER